jgi:RNA polymerase sigma factor (sigma-70 family)
MAANRANTVIQHIRKALLLRDGAELTDGQLLACFLEHRDEAAFAALVRRHGPMVWGVCRRLLGHHDAEDAFQAAFLVLFRKAASIRPRGMVGNWLYGVAHRAASHAARTAARRRVREKQVTEMPDAVAAPQGQGGDLLPLLDRELSRLPDKYRCVVVLCDLEGRTRKEAARQLGLPEGTVAGRLARARAVLAKRLARHGLAVSGGTLAAVLSDKAAACVPAGVSDSALKVAKLAAAGQASANAISAKVAALTEGVVKAMFLNKLRVVAVVLLTAGVLTFSAGRLLVPTAAGTAAAGEKEKGRQGAEATGVGEPLAVQVRIVRPAGMKVFVLTAAGGQKASPVEVPGRLNLEQGRRHRLKLADIPNRPGVERFPTVEIFKVDATTEPFVSSSAIPVEFTDTDFDHVNGGETITKAVYLRTGKKGQRPGGRQGELTTIASYDLEPDVDVIEEAGRRGTVLAVVRMGDIDLGAAEPEKGKGRNNLPVEKATGEAVKVGVGDDPFQGRVVRPSKGKATADDAGRRQLADQLEHLMREVAAVQAENEDLRQRLKKAELEIRSLRDSLDRKEQESKKAGAGSGK